MVSNRVFYFSSHWSSSYLGPRNDFLYSSPTGTTTRRSCHGTCGAFFPDTTLKTLKSRSASCRLTVNMSPTVKSHTSAETVSSSEASESIPTHLKQHSPSQSAEPQDKTSTSPRINIRAAVGIGLGILIFMALALAILWFRHRQNHNQRKPTMNVLEREPNPSFEEDSAKSPRVRSDGLTSQNHSWLADGRNIERETHKLPLWGPGLSVLNTTTHSTDDVKSSSASKPIKNSIYSSGPLGDADAASRFLDQSVPMAVPGTLASEARSSVSPEENPSPSSEEMFPLCTRQAHSSRDLDPPPHLAARKSHEFFLPISQQESKDAPSPSASSFIILDSPQSITPEVRSGGVRAHLRDNPHPLRSNSSASRGTLADPPNHRKTNIANHSPGGNSAAVGPAITGEDSLDAKNDSAATIQNFSRKIGSLHSRQGRDSGG